MKKITKFKKFKHYKLKRSTDHAPTAAPADGAQPPTPQSGDAITESNKTDQAMNQFRDENRGTGKGMWEYLGA